MQWPSERVIVQTPTAFQCGETLVEFLRSSSALITLGCPTRPNKCVAMRRIESQPRRPTRSEVQTAQVAALSTLSRYGELTRELI
jgi:hypothetical protein